MRNWVFVKVTTNEPGLVGWGEATLEWKTRAVCAAVEDLSPLVVGEDPTRIEHLWQRMTRGQFFPGGVVGMSAVSGIDQALWDIAGKRFGVPTWELFGGAVRQRLRMYDHLGGGDSSVVYGTKAADSFAEAAAASVKDGFTALKLLPVPVGSGLPSSAQLTDVAEVMMAVRESVGDKIDLMVDFHGRTGAAAAIRYAAAMAESQPWFIEEPCQPGDPAELARVARATAIPVAAGERLIQLSEFNAHLAAGAVAILQPDVCHVGGPTALRKIAALAEAQHVPLAPHNPLGPIATMVNQHLGIALPSVMIQEVMRGDVPWRDEVVLGVLPIVDGHVSPPHQPGWGVDVDERAAAKHPYQPEPALRSVNSDGSFADW
jgi:galactonate dehydratase